MPLSSTETDQKIAAQAAEWLVLLDDNDDPELKQQFANWLAQNPKHQAAAARIAKRLGDVESVSSDYLDPYTFKQLFEKTRKQQHKDLRHFKNSILGMTLLASSMLLSALFYAPMPYWLADQRNRSQSWQQIVLADRSIVHLAGKTAYNIQYQPQSRTVELLQGNIMVDVAKDRTRPFRVKTAYGTVQALGTRFVVSQTDHKTVITMLQSKTAVWSAQHPEQKIEILTGQRITLDENGFINRHPLQLNAALFERAWQQKVLVVNGENLVDVLDYLAMFYTGKISFDRQALSKLKVTATLPLDDVDRALQQLADELHLSLNTTMPYLRHIEKL